MIAPPHVMFRALLLSTTALVVALNLLACGVEQKRSGLPAAAQAAIDNITNDLASGDYAKIYADAADEWRRAASAEDSRANLERIRNVLGKVLSREQLSASEQMAGVEDHSLVISYNTKFERADAIETFTLVERSGRWLLAGYAVNSNALK
jgi:hypothetical protein